MVWYWSYPESEDEPESNNHSPYWPHPASLSTGFLQISTEAAMAYSMSLLKAEAEDSSVAEASDCTASSDEDGSSDDDDSNNSPSPVICSNDNSDETENSKSDSKNHVPGDAEINHTESSELNIMDEQKTASVSATIMLPPAFSTLSASKKKMELPPPRKSTKPSELTLYELVMQTKETRRIRRLQSELCERNDVWSPATKKRRLCFEDSDDDDDDDSSDSSDGDSGVQEMSNSDQGSLMEIDNEDLFCYETFLETL